MSEETTEQTVQMILDLPDGQKWAWLPDCNILAVSARLTPAEREQAIDELQSTWRRQFIKAVPDAEEDGEGGVCPDVA